MSVRVLRMSTLFGRTLRDDPADADVASHRLLLRAGYVRRAAPGIYTWLPLGWMVLRNVERIVREEMEAAGFQEVHLPALLPRDPYEASGRWTDYGDTLFRLQDRRGADYLLGPTHEEMFTLLVKDICTSYRDLPVRIFQIQTKYRDEPRPRAGLLRGREFVMKDSYSFDLDGAGLGASYEAHRAAYIRTFDRLGLPYVIVAAMSGAMGGSASEEFLAPMDAGEDTFVRCPSCAYAANVEAVITTVPDAPDGAEAPAARIEDTPGTPTIETLVEHLNTRPELRRADGRAWTAADTLKNVVVALVHPDGRRDALAVGLPGDRELDVKRLEAQVAPAEVVPFGDDDFAAHPTLVKGYIGPSALGTANGSVRYLLDPRVVPGSSWVTGANEAGRHVVGLVAGRDFKADGIIEAAEVRAGDPCTRCGAGVELRRGVEIGHIFQLGRKYADALGLEVLGPDGRMVPVTMGSYGIGLSRAVAAIAETTLDELGLCWPPEVAPARAHIVPVGKGDDIRAYAETLADALAAAGTSVILDDRADASAGVKLRDAELLGMPTIVVVGRGLADGVIEVRDRRSGAVTSIAADDAARSLCAREPTSHERRTGAPWDASYRDGPAPWDIGGPQPAVVRLAAGGGFTGAVLDAGCGTGENALHVASLGLPVVGFDVAETALASARAKANERGIDVELVAADAFALERLHRRFDTVLDCGLFHTFDESERRRYVDSLASVTERGGALYILCFSDEGSDLGPHPVTQDELRAAFGSGTGWSVVAIDPERIKTRFHADGAPAWLATIRRD